MKRHASEEGKVVQKSYGEVMNAGRESRRRGRYSVHVMRAVA